MRRCWRQRVTVAVVLLLPGGGTDREVDGNNVTWKGEDSGQNSVGSEEGKMTSEGGSNGSDGVYDFKDNKTAGTFTVTKEWNDKRMNEERPEPEIKISTKKPSKNALGYTVTFHGNENSGLAFADGSYVNEVVYNNNGQIVDGIFKMPVGFSTDTVSWCIDKALTNKVNVSEDGVLRRR